MRVNIVELDTNKTLSGITYPKSEIEAAIKRLGGRDVYGALYGSYGSSLDSMIVDIYNIRAVFSDFKIENGFMTAKVSPLMGYTIKRNSEYVLCSILNLGDGRVASKVTIRTIMIKEPEDA